MANDSVNVNLLMATAPPDGRGVTSTNYPGMVGLTSAVGLQIPSSVGNAGADPVFEGSGTDALGFFETAEGIFALSLSAVNPSRWGARSEHRCSVHTGRRK